MKIQDVVPNCYFETKTVEFKERLDQENVLGWVKTVVGFANTNGGVMILGVRDFFLDLVGYRFQDVNEEVLRFQNVISTHVRPLPITNFDYIKYTKGEKELFLIKITIAPSKKLPVVAYFDNLPLIFVRYEGKTSPATAEDIQNMVMKSENVFYDTYPTDIVFDDRSFTKLYDVYREKKGKSLNKNILESIRNFFCDDEMHLSRGASMFMDSFHGYQTLIKVACWPSINKGGDSFSSFDSFDGNLIDGIAFIVDFVAKNNQTIETKTPTGRTTRVSFPERSVFEAAANAVCHRNYFEGGTQINVDIFLDRLVISSPGGLLQNAELDKEYDLSVIRPKRRNELICSVLEKIGLIENEYSGFVKIAEDYYGEDQSHKPFVSSSSHRFEITLPNLLYGPGVITPDTIPDVNTLHIVDETKHDKAILAFAYFKERTIKEIAEHLHLAVSSKLRDEILERLVQQGFLNKRKDRNRFFYIANHAKTFVK